MQFGTSTRLLEKTCALAKELNLLIVADAKRGDISSTGAAYAQAILANDGPLACDSVTLNPWMGIDTLDPFIRLVEDEGKGLFVLLRTTNPKSTFFQHHGSPNASTVLASQLHKLAQSNIGHSGMSNIGAVVGASAHEEAQRYRKIHPSGWFLVPGVGAQGATPTEGLAGGNIDGLGSLIVASRSLLFPKEPIRTSDYDVSPDGVQKSVRNATTELVRSVMQVLDA